MSEQIVAPEISQKEWDVFCENLHKKRSRAFEAMQKWTNVNERGWIFAWDEIKSSFLEKVYEQYPPPKCSQYVAWHIFNGGSGMTPAEIPLLDFPGNLSLEKLLDGIIDGTIGPQPLPAKTKMSAANPGTLHA